MVEHDFGVGLAGGIAGIVGSGGSIAGNIAGIGLELLRLFQNRATLPDEPGVDAA